MKVGSATSPRPAIAASRKTSPLLTPSLFADTRTLCHSPSIRNRDADFVVVGIGVRPETALAEHSGIVVDRGVTVDAYLETNIPGIWAVGDIARWPDRLTGETIRIKYWVVAERQGQTAARDMLGARERFDAVPFFWTQQHDFSLPYVGHAAKWDRVEIEGSLAAKDCTVTYRQGSRKLAVLTIARDRDSLAAEIELERTITAVI